MISSTLRYVALWGINYDKSLPLYLTFALRKQLSRVSTVSQHRSRGDGDPTFLDFHLVKQVVALDCLRQGHDLVGHESEIP